MMVIAQAVGDGERIIEAHLMRFLSLIELGQMTEARQEAVTLSRAVEAAPSAGPDVARARQSIRSLR